MIWREKEGGREGEREGGGGGRQAYIYNDEDGLNLTRGEKERRDRYTHEAESE